MKMPGLKVGYVLKVFPRLSETFILNEILELEAQGLPVDIFSLYPPADPRFHGAVGRLNAEITYLPRPDSSDMWQRIWSKGRNDGELDVSEAGAAILEALRRPDSDGLKLFLQGLYLAAEVRKRGIDHLHAHFATSATSVARTASSLSGVSFSFTAHAKDIYQREQRESLLAEALERCAFAVTVTDFNLAHLQRVSPRAKAKVRRIYNGVDTGALLPVSLPGSEAPLLVSVGRLVEKKGFPYLIEACRLLKDRGQRFRCAIVGAGERESQLRELIARLDLTGDVSLHGPQSHELVLEMISNASVVVLPCIIGEDGNRDALPTVLLEAMALGRPVVSTDLEGITEIVNHGETGFLVPQRDSVSLAEAVHCLLLDPNLREACGRAGRCKAERLFSLKRNVAELAGLFQEHAGRHESVTDRRTEHAICT